MQQSTLMLNMLSSWVLAVIYDRIKINTGIEIKLLLCASVITMVVGMCLFCRKPRKTDKGGA